MLFYLNHITRDTINYRIQNYILHIVFSQNVNSSDDLGQATRY